MANAAEESTPTRVGRRRDSVPWLVGLTVALLGASLWSATVGAAEIPPLRVAAIVLGEVPGIPATAGGTHHVIVWQFRLPRVVLAALVGGGLGAAGAVMQGLFRNPMADPSIIGVSSGAAAGAVAVIVLPIAVPFGIPIAAFGGAVLAAFGVYLLATEDGYTPIATLLLSGVAIQTFLGALVSLLLVRAPRHSLREALFWLLGSIRETDWIEVQLVAPVVVVGVVMLYAKAADLNVLLLGEVDAASLGVEVERTKRLLLGIAAVVTGAAVAFVGVIGFVGLIVPHVLRLLIGPDHRTLIPGSALAGATFLVVADTIVRGSAPGVPVGVLTALVGAPFFLYLLRTEEVTEL